MSRGKDVFKVVAIGDGGVGKTSLLYTYAKKTFPSDYVPTVFDNFQTDIKTKHKTYTLQLWDTAGQEHFEQLRVLSYPNTDCFLICFALDWKSSLENVIYSWYKDLKQNVEPKKLKETLIFLVGCKADLVEDAEKFRKVKSRENYKKMETSMIEKTEKEIGACMYIRTSAKEGRNVDYLFQQILKRLNEKRTKEEKRLKKKKKKFLGIGSFEDGYDDFLSAMVKNVPENKRNTNTPDADMGNSSFGDFYGGSMNKKNSETE